MIVEVGRMFASVPAFRVFDFGKEHFRSAHRKDLVHGSLRSRVGAGGTGMFNDRPLRLLDDSFAGVHRVAEFLNSHLNNVGVARLARTTKARNGDYLTVAKSLAEPEHPVAQAAFIRLVAVSESFRISDKSGIPAHTQWCDFTPPGQK
jgi:hypothetical protein